MSIPETLTSPALLPSMLSDLSGYISIIQATDHQQATPISPSAASLCPQRTGVTLSGQEVYILTHQNHDINYHLQKLLDDWIAILRRAVQVPSSFDDSLRPAHVRHFWAAEWKRRRPESPLEPPIPPRGSDDDICFEHMKIVWLFAKFTVFQDADLPLAFRSSIAP